MKILFFDFETTGLCPFKNEIITAGVIDDKEHQFNFRPEKLSTYGGEEIHGISKEKALAFSERHQSLIAMLQLFTPDSYLCCYANPKQKKSVYLYDIAMLKGWLFQENYDLYQAFCRTFTMEKQIDVYSMAKEAHKNKQLYGLKKKGKKYSFSLDSLANAFNFEFKHHNAIEDVRVTKKIFEKLSEITPIRYLSDI
jgi:DNA polymerase III epsilon subunit-like protein